MTQLTATFTVTIKTKPDGDYYFDHDDLVRNAVPWIEGGLDDRDDIAEVTITEQPAAVSAAVAPPAQAELRQRIAEALLDHLSRTADIRPGRDGEQAFMPEVTDAERMRMADAVLAVLPEPADRAAVSREAEAELYVLLRKAGEPRDEAQALIDRHRDEVLRRAELRRMADEAATTEAHPAECTASRSGDCLREAESETACDTEAGECVHGGQPAIPVQHAPGKAIRCPDCRAKGYAVCLDEPAVGARQDGATQ